MKARAAVIAALALLAAPATAHASAQIDVTCERVTFDYSQWPSGPPDVSHSSVRVDGSFLFDEVVSFSGSTHRVEVPLNLNDGKEHTIEAKHDWSNHDAGTKEARVTLTCGSPPPVAEPSPPQEQPAPPVPAAPAAPALAPTAPESAPIAPARGTKSRERAKRRAAKRRRQRVAGSPREAAGTGAGDLQPPAAKHGLTEPRK